MILSCEDKGFVQKSTFSGRRKMLTINIDLLNILIIIFYGNNFYRCDKDGNGFHALV